MGNALRCFDGGEDDDRAGGGDRYPYYRPTSRPFPTRQLQSGGTDHQPPAPTSPPPTHHWQVGGPHGVLTAATPGGVDGLDEDMDMPYIVFQSGVEDAFFGRRLSTHHQCHCNTTSTTEEDIIDESSAEGLVNAETYVKTNAMLIQVQVLGTPKTFWRLSDEAAKISRKLALILRSYHSARKYLAAPLQMSNVWISRTSGIVKLRGVRFSDKRFGIKRVRDDYRDLSRVLQGLLRLSSGEDVISSRLPPDYREFLKLLGSDTLKMEDEFLIVNHPALLPMSNRTGVFLMLYDRMVTSLGHTKAGKEMKKRMLAKLPYKKNWLDTAIANTHINEYMAQSKYNRGPLDLLRLNRNVRSHLRKYNEDNMEEILYCEWPELLMDMVKVMHAEGELQCMDIQNKFG